MKLIFVNIEGKIEGGIFTSEDEFTVSGINDGLTIRKKTNRINVKYKDEIKKETINLKEFKDITLYDSKIVIEDKTKFEVILLVDNSKLELIENRVKKGETIVNIIRSSFLIINQKSNKLYINIDNDSMVYFSKLKLKEELKGDFIKDINLFIRNPKRERKILKKLKEIGENQKECTLKKDLKFEYFVLVFNFNLVGLGKALTRGNFIREDETLEMTSKGGLKITSKLNDFCINFSKKDCQYLLNIFGLLYKFSHKHVHKYLV